MLITYLVAFLVVFTACGETVMVWSSETLGSNSYSTTFMNQVTDDWDMIPFSDFIATNDTYCPTGYTEFAFSRKFYGTTVGCDCMGINSRWIIGPNTMNIGLECDHNQTKYGCTQANSMFPVVQPYFNGTIICAATTSTAFVNATRPEQSTL